MSMFERVRGAAKVGVLVLTVFVWLSASVAAQAQSPNTRISAIVVDGNQRVEDSTVASYLTVAPGDFFDPNALHTSFEVLFATGLFADVAFEQSGSVLIVRVLENPIINRVIFEGNRSLGDDKLTEEIQAQPRAIFTRARVQADVQRIIELYRQSGRFAAQVTPKVVEQPQNRVDLVFEISEGPVTGVRRINFIGNEAYRDRRLRDEVLTAESRWWRIFSSNDNYDPGRLDYDRELLREFYTDRGYADFRVVSAVAELTPDQQDFYITYVIDEGAQYAFGDISVSTELDILDPEVMRAIVSIQDGQLYQASRIEDAVDALTFAAGAAGYAFVNVSPRVQRNREDQTIDIDFAISEGPRVYVERIDIIGNTRTVDSVIRREMQLVEGDAFNKVSINRSQTRVRALGFFENVEISEQPGTLPDRAILEVAVTEQPTGELSFGAGFSSIDAFLVDLSITERNLRGRGQFLRFRVSASSRRQIIDIRFTEPRFLGRNIAAGVDLFSTRQDFITEANFETESIGGSLRLGFPVTEAASLGLRYTLRQDDVTAFGDALSLLNEEEGRSISSVVGYTLRWDRRNDPITPTGGFDLALSQDLAGVGGDVRFLRSELQGTTYRGLIRNVVASIAVDAGYVAEWGGEDVRINDRFFKGGGSFRGFETAGLGPRIVTENTADGTVIPGNARGGQFFAIGTGEITFPLGLPEEYGIKGALFAEAGYLGVNKDPFDEIVNTDSLGNVTSITSLRDDLSLRASTGVSIFWNSPFGPIRFDFSDVLAREEYDRTESFRFSTITRF